MNRRLLRRLLAVLAVALVVLVGGPAQAQAAQRALPIPGTGPACEGPTPELPSQGVAGWLLPNPDPVPPHADPWAPGAQTTYYQQYGLAGMTWHVCDIHGGLNPLPDQLSEAPVVTTGANWMMSVPKIAVALLATLIEVAFNPTWLRVFEPLLSNGTQALWNALGDPAALPVLMILVIILLWKVRKLDVAFVLSQVGIVAALLLGVGLVLTFPVAIAQGINGIAPSILGGVGSELQQVDGSTSGAATATTGAVVEGVVKQQWETGAFGEAGTDTAETFGPRLLKASAFTWAEAERYRQLSASPAPGESYSEIQERRAEALDMVEDKQDAYADAMDDLKEADPIAYDHATGRDSDSRVGGALASNLAALLGLPFIVISCIVLLSCYLAVIIGIVWFAGSAIFGAVSPGLATSPLGTMAAASVNAVRIGIAIQINLLALRLLLDPATGIPFALAVVLCIATTVVALVVVKPFQQLWGIFGHEHRSRTRKYTRKILKRGRGQYDERLAPHVNAQLAATRDELRDGFREVREEVPQHWRARRVRVAPGVRVPSSVSGGGWQSVALSGPGAAILRRRAARAAKRVADERAAYGPHLQGYYDATHGRAMPTATAAAPPAPRAAAETRPPAKKAAAKKTTAKKTTSKTAAKKTAAKKTTKRTPRKSVVDDSRGSYTVWDGEKYVTRDRAPGRSDSGETA